jgi:hypothetical protein
LHRKLSPLAQQARPGFDRASPGPGRAGPGRPVWPSLLARHKDRVGRVGDEICLERTKSAPARR